MDVLFYVPVAQLDRALDSDSKGRWFESSRAYQSSVQTYCLCGIFFIKIFIAIPLFPQMCLYTAGSGSTAFKSTTGNKIFREYYLII